MNVTDIIMKISRRLTLILDTNLLLVLCVGTADRSYIAKHKRTLSYTEDDFDLLKKIVAWFPKAVVTPHILTEVSNLAAQTGGSLRDKIMAVVAAITIRLNEESVGSSEIAKEEAFIRLGLTDVGIGLIAKSDYIFITDDSTLALHLQSKGIDCLNFKYLKSNQV